VKDFLKKALTSFIESLSLLKGEEVKGYKPVTSFTKQTGHMVYALKDIGKEELADALGANQCHGSTSSVYRRLAQW
jgi:hypothetical protein